MGGSLSLAASGYILGHPGEKVILNEGRSRLRATAVKNPENLGCAYEAIAIWILRFAQNDSFFEEESF